MKFTTNIFKIGINPYVLLPVAVLNNIFKQAGKEKGHIPVNLIINKKKFIQTLVKYSGKWRLYLNGPMRKIAGKDVGDRIEIDIEYDSGERNTPIHAMLREALDKNKIAKNNFLRLPPSRQKEIARYINNLKTVESIRRNVERAIGFLQGKERFVGREKP